jgi:hypothetical protein
MKGIRMKPQYSECFRPDLNTLKEGDEVFVVLAQSGEHVFEANVVKPIKWASKKQKKGFIGLQIAFHADPV